jgi:hypothetical protein
MDIIVTRDGWMQFAGLSDASYAARLLYSPAVQYVILDEHYVVTLNVLA